MACGGGAARHRGGLIRGYEFPLRLARVKAFKTLTVAPILPTPLTQLRDLAKNLRWSWRPETERLFESIDPEAYQASGRNPVVLLDSLPASRVNGLANNAEFLHRLQIEVDGLDSYLGLDRWFHKQTRGSDDGETCIAYFSMEFGITQALPVYSGGLGVLSGDHMKSASDLGVPIIGIGLLYTYGYFTQTLSRDGWQQENYTPHPPSTLPIDPVVDEAGTQLQVSVTFPDGRDVDIAVWKAQVGLVSLLLLDTDIDSNPEEFRSITDRLYGGDVEHRIKQELILGVGGVRAVQAYTASTGEPAPNVFHLNEGHAGFSGVERIGQIMATGESFESAIATVRASTIFTTHTPVPAGIDRFDVQLAHRYLAADADGNSKLVPGVPVDRVIRLGAEDDPSRFNMAHLGLRLAQYANGVAQLHGRVSREMFADLFPNFDSDEVPITSITNGVHIPTWTRSAIKPAIAAMSGNRDVSVARYWNMANAVGTEELWRVRNELRGDLVTRARDSVRTSWLARGAQEAEIGWVRDLLDPGILTIGFARRVSTYKRLTLMLQDPERFARILTNPDRPVQFVIAGKAHPADMGGKQLLQEVVRFADESLVRDRVVFLPDYNVTIALILCAGTDVWLNNPVRPQEASGTSGMKAVMNGGLTFSISDGWWDEFADDRFGWTIPTANHADERTRHLLEANSLYDILENEIAPMFYERDDRDIPQAWMTKVRDSMSILGPQVSAERMVRDYVTELYLPAGHSARRIAEANAPREFVAWRERVTGAWSDVLLADVRNETPTPTAGQHVRISAVVKLGGGLDRHDVRVEAIAGRKDYLTGDIIDPEYFEMTPDPSSDSRYCVDIPVDRPGEVGYTVRIVPQHELLRSPAELSLVRIPTS